MSVEWYHDDIGELAWEVDASATALQSTRDEIESLKLAAAHESGEDKYALLKKAAKLQADLEEREKAHAAHATELSLKAASQINLSSPKGGKSENKLMQFGQNKPIVPGFCQIKFRLK